MVLIHAMVSNKYIGYFISILLIFALDILLLIADVQSNMISLGATPWITYSDMNAFGPALISSIWFNLYWISFALICLFLATMIWKRGTQANFKEKLGLIKKGNPIGTPDLLIAGIAIENNFELITNNQKHYQPIKELVTNNWKK